MNILITGASRGIGYELAKNIASDSNNKLVAIARNEKSLLQLKDDVNRLYKTDNVFPLVFDIENIFKDSSTLLTEIRKHISNVDILINNAGFLGKGMFEETHSTLARKIFNINFFAPAELIRVLMPLLGVSRQSHVVNIGSMGAYQGSAKFPGISYYSASKAALASLTECLAEELKDKNIAFNCLALGSVQTEMLEEAFPGYKAQMQANEMAEFITGFALTGNKYFNGKILPVSLATP